MRPRLLVCGLAAAVALSACAVLRKAGEDVVGHVTKGDFYVVPAPLPLNDPGELIRHERLLGAPHGAIAWRVMYHSRDANGNDIAVTGVVVAPTGPAPRDGRPVVAWAHPTTGTAPRCAPSSGIDPFVLIEGLRDLVHAGYVVVATDHYLAGDPSVVEPWASWLRENTPSTTAIAVPIFIAQGNKDTLVRPQTTFEYVAGLCAAGKNVHFEPILDTGHGLVALKAFNDVSAWFRDLVRGRTVTSTCARPERGAPCGCVYTGRTGPAGKVHWRRSADSWSSYSSRILYITRAKPACQSCAGEREQNVAGQRFARERGSPPSRNEMRRKLDGLRMTDGSLGVSDHAKGATMRVARVFVALAVVVSSMLFAGVSASSAQTNSLSFGHTTLAFNGLGVNVTLNLVCDPSLNVAFVNATVAEVSGHRVAQGAASFVNDFPGVPCTGSTETIPLTVFTFSGFAFKNGNGFASADVTLFDPVNFSFTNVIAGPTAIRITKK